jgi:hypothetical protein
MYFPANMHRDVMEKVMRNRGLDEEDIKFALDCLRKQKGEMKRRIVKYCVAIIKSVDIINIKIHKG